MPFLAASANSNYNPFDSTKPEHNINVKVEMDDDTEDVTKDVAQLSLNQGQSSDEESEYDC